MNIIVYQITMDYYNTTDTYNITTDTYNITTKILWKYYSHLWVYRPAVQGFMGKSQILLMYSVHVITKVGI